MNPYSINIGVYISRKTSIGYLATNAEKTVQRLLDCIPNKSLKYRAERDGPTLIIQSPRKMTFVVYYFVSCGFRDLVGILCGAVML